MTGVLAGTWKVLAGRSGVGVFNKNVYTGYKNRVLYVINHNTHTHTVIKREWHTVTESVIERQAVYAETAKERRRKIISVDPGTIDPVDCPRETPASES